MTDGFAHRTATNNAALITGATSGIGYELAKLFARDRARLILVARSSVELARVAQELSAAYGSWVKVIVKDLARPGAAEEIAQELARDRVHVDALVNNAGFGVYGLFARNDARQELDMIQVNVTALVHLTKRLLPGMLEARSGRILNVASTAAFQPGPLMAIYYASKAFVLSFSEALANELRGTGVTVTALCPGPTRTRFQVRSGMEHARLMQGQIMDPAAVAKMGYDGMRRGKALVIPGLRNQALAFTVRVMPRRVVTSVVRWIQDSREPRRE